MQADQETQAAPSDEARRAKPVRAPEGSRYDAENKRPPARTLRRRIRRMLSGFGVTLAVWILPYIYIAYCRFVWATSRIDDRLTPLAMPTLDRHDRFVTLMWHQEVFSVAHGYRHFHGHTLASVGPAGRVITRMLELNGYTVFRGGSSRKKTRKRRVLQDMIQHMSDRPRVSYGLTVDGSNGPAMRMKNGAVSIAQAGCAPLLICRTWFSRKITLPTWDRMVIPLPFGRIRMWGSGPYWLARDASGEEFSRMCAHLQAELLDLAELSFRAFEKRPPPEPRYGFPEGWEPRWKPGQIGIPLGPHDLRPDDPPPWAHLTPERP